MPNSDRMYYVYIMASRTRVLYTGMTGALKRRVAEHRQHSGDSFTARYRCDRLVYFERYGWVENAIARETQLKKWRREKKVALILRTNPSWADLSEGWYEKNSAGSSTAVRRQGDETSGRNDTSLSFQGAAELEKQAEA